VGVPGPPGVLWAVALPLWALAVATLGEAVRGLGARWIALWRLADPVERGLVDLYLGGGLLYLVAALPLDLFDGPVVEGLLVGGAVLLLYRVYRRRRAARPMGPAPRAPSFAILIALAAAAGLYLVELAQALPVASGNTFDSSLLVTYTALLLHHGSIPLSFRPYATTMILYPQGTTVWLGAAELVFGSAVPAPRVPLLVTPLFLGLAPLAGYAAGRRLFRTDAAAAAIAVSTGVLGPSTRALVGGSNDFAIAFPLVLLLAGLSTAWIGERPPRWSDALGFGLLVGYSAALNPVGAEWLMPGLVLLAAVGRPRFGRDLRAWAGRWGAALGAALLGVLPSLYVLAQGWHSPGFVPGAAGPPGALRTGVNPGALLGDLDPFLFGPKALALSPVPLLRAELAGLLLVGVALLALPRPDSALGEYLGRFRRWAFAFGAAIVGWLLLLTGAWLGVRALAFAPAISSGAELSLWLFTVYGLAATVPLVVLAEWLAARARSPRPVPVPRTPAAPRRAWSPDAPPSAPILPLVLALAIVGPGIVLTPVSFAPTLGALYQDFGRGSGADFALLTYAGSAIPAGGRVLVAPGSFAEFLPAYAPDVVLLYPLVPGFPWVNSSYRTVISELTNGTLDAAGRAALASLAPGYVLVTGNNTNLWPPISPAPLLADPSAFDPLWNEADAYVFSVNDSAL
jgi:hypothetical protein